MGESGGLYKVLVGQLRGNWPLGRNRLRWEIILRWILRKWDVRAWSRSMCFSIGTGGRHL